MAKVQFGGIVTGLRGKVGGSVFSFNKSGATYGVKTTAKKKGPKKMVQANYMSQTAMEWRKMLNSDRLSFNAAASLYPQTNSLGQTYYLTGFQLYCKWSGNLSKISNAPLGFYNDPALPDYNLNNTALDSIDFGIVAGIDIVLTSAGGNSNTYIKVFCSRAVSVGKASVSGAYKFILNADQQTGSYNIPTSVFKELQGNVLVGQAVFFKIEVYNQLSGFQTQLTNDYKVVVVA